LELHAAFPTSAMSKTPGETMRSCLLLLIGVPIPVIGLLWLLTGHL
jgi:hypothetical protein